MGGPWPRSPAPLVCRSAGLMGADEIWAEGERRQQQKDDEDEEVNLCPQPLWCHYTGEINRKIDGETKLRRDLLEAWGWGCSSALLVLHVPKQKLEKKGDQQKKKPLCLHMIQPVETHKKERKGRFVHTADSPRLLRRRKTISQMRMAMMMSSSKQPITMPATSPPFRHVAETKKDFDFVSSRHAVVKCWCG